ncbi:MAG: hypothetical protein ACKO23_18305, partial [Gemmataceae bacterium]
FRAAAVYFFLGAGFSLLGIMHSPLGDERIDFPWRVIASVDGPFQKAITYMTPYHWAGAYTLMGLILLGLAAWGVARPISAPVSHDEDEERASAI